MTPAQTTSESKARITIEQYLVRERAAFERSEYFDGIIVAMAGESPSHGLVSANLVIEVGAQLKEGPCFALTKDSKVRSGLGIASARTSKGMFSYPDLMVVCGDPEYFDEHRDVLLNPTAIFEVLSPTTENYDRGEKFHRYQTWNPTLKDYLLVAQDKPQVEHFHREDDGKWTYQLHMGLDATVTIPSIRCAVKLAEVYRKVKFNEGDEQ